MIRRSGTRFYYDLAIEQSMLDRLLLCVDQVPTLCHWLGCKRNGLALYAVRSHHEVQEMLGMVFPPSPDMGSFVYREWGVPFLSAGLVQTERNTLSLRQHIYTSMYRELPPECLLELETLFSLARAIIDRVSWGACPRWFAVGAGLCLATCLVKAPLRSAMVDDVARTKYSERSQLISAELPVDYASPVYQAACYLEVRKLVLQKGESILPKALRHFRWLGRSETV